MAWEAARCGNWRRLALAHLVLRHKLVSQDPLAPSTDDGALIERLLSDHEVDQAVAMSILGEP
jgi:hypothetical protein